MRAEAQECGSDASKLADSTGGSVYHADRNALGLLGLMRRAGKLGTGEAGTRQTVRSGEAKLILLASDASPNAVKRAAGFAAKAGVPMLRLDADQAALCAAAGASGGVIFSVCEEGFARAFIRKLSSASEAQVNS